MISFIRIAQLKVNLRPVWSPAAEALSQLSERFDAEVWNIVFDELQSSMGPDSDSTVHSLRTSEWMSEDDTAEEDDISEEEKTWRDPSAHKFRVAVKKWIQGNMTRKSVIQVREFSFH